MKNEAITYLVTIMALLLVSLSVAPACAQLQPSPVPTPPKPQVTHPPVPVTTSDNQSASEGETPPASPSTNEEKWYPVATYTGVINGATPVFRIYGNEWHLKWTINADDLETAVFRLGIYPKQQPFAVWQTFSNAGSTNGTLNYFISGTDERDLLIKVTAQNLRQWTITIEDSATAATSYPVQITFIHYLGTLFPPDPAAGFCYERVEPDEYVVIKNLSTSSQDMTGWTLKNISKPSPTFKFPEFTIYPGQILRIYTDEYHPETGRLTFYYGYGDLWSNDHSDIAVLYDEMGNEVSRKSYAVPVKPNEAAQ